MVDGDLNHIANEVRRLVFAHIGRPMLKATDRGEKPPFGQFGRDGQVFRLPMRSEKS